MSEAELDETGACICAGSKSQPSALAETDPEPVAETGAGAAVGVAAGSFVFVGAPVDVRATVFVGATLGVGVGVGVFVAGGVDADAARCAGSPRDPLAVAAARGAAVDGVDAPDGDVDELVCGPDDPDDAGDLDAGAVEETEEDRPAGGVFGAAGGGPTPGAVDLIDSAAAAKPGAVRVVVGAVAPPDPPPDFAVLAFGAADVGRLVAPAALCAGGVDPPAEPVPDDDPEPERGVGSDFGLSAPLAGDDELAVPLPRTGVTIGARAIVFREAPPDVPARVGVGFDGGDAAPTGFDVGIGDGNGDVFGEAFAGDAGFAPGASVGARGTVLAPAVPVRGSVRVVVVRPGGGAGASAVCFTRSAIFWSGAIGVCWSCSHSATSIASSSTTEASSSGVFFVISSSPRSRGRRSSRSLPSRS